MASQRLLDDVEDVGLHVAHDGVGPHGGVGVEVGGEALVAAEVEEGVAVGERFEVVLAGEDIEEAAADGDVLVERGGGDGGGVGLDGEDDALVGIPVGDGFGEVEAALEAGVADAADAFVRECGFDGAGEADGVGPGGRSSEGAMAGTRSMFCQTMESGAWMTMEVSTVRVCSG